MIMMTNLFSAFDPSTGMMSMNWMSMIIPMIMMPIKYWNSNNKITLIQSIMSNNMNKEINMAMKLKGTSLFMLTLMFTIMIINMMGLLPYVYTPTSQLSMTMSMALPMWLSSMIYGWITKTNLMLAHLLPSGTPPMLMPFMVMIESTSNIIRPGSLAVRLSANMIAGHLIMSLLGNNTSNMHLMMIMFLLMMMFEMAVSMIQSYVFMTLMNLYSSEI